MQKEIQEEIGACQLSKRMWYVVLVSMLKKLFIKQDKYRKFFPRNEVFLWNTKLGSWKQRQQFNQYTFVRVIAWSTRYKTTISLNNLPKYTAIVLAFSNINTYKLKVHTGKWYIYYSHSRCNANILYTHYLHILINSHTPILYAHPPISLHTHSHTGYIHSHVRTHLRAPTCAHPPVRTHLCTLTCGHPPVHTHLCALTCAHSPVDTHLCTLTCAHLPVRTHLCAPACAHSPVRTHLCAPTCAHSPVQSYLHTHLPPINPNLLTRLFQSSTSVNTAIDGCLLESYPWVEVSGWLVAYSRSLGKQHVYREGSLCD